jgi:glycine oxidase
MTTPGRANDVVIAGGGLVALACALAAADRGLRVRLVAGRDAGMASAAAAGLLAPSIDPAEGAAHDFAVAGRDAYPAFLDSLEERTGLRVPLDRSGVLQAAVSARGVRGLRRAMPAAARWLDAAELREIEPALGHALGGVLHPDDGYVDNVALLAALDAAVSGTSAIARTDGRVVAVATRADGATVTTADGEAIDAAAAVLAGGAWTPAIAGLPRAIPVEPVRGQVAAFGETGLRRAVFGPTGYLVPRGRDRTLVGSTVERVGFDPATTAAGIQRLERTAAEILPALAGQRPLEAWAGLRPMTPDGQPLLGRDPEAPALVYACGHSRNGILMTPVTGAVIAALLVGDDPGRDLAPFDPARFDVARGGGQP